MAEAAMRAADAVRARKMKPIYEALDSYNYKAALKLTSKKDVANHPEAKTLRAFALARIGHEGDALEICDEVLATKPVDEQVLHMLQQVYSLTGHPERTTAAYEHALAKDPKNEDLAVELHMCYVRAMKPKKQQALAMKLFKAYDNARYMAWAVTAMAQQQLGTGGVGAAAGPNKVLQLAEMMLQSKVLAPGHGREAETLGLYVHLLSRQGKLREALAALDGPFNGPADSDASSGGAAAAGSGAADDEDEEFRRLLPSPMEAVVTLRARANVLVDARRWDAAFAAFAQLLSEFDADDWAYHCGLVHSVFRVVHPRADAAAAPSAATPDADALATGLAALSLEDVPAPEGGAPSLASARALLSGLKDKHGKTLRGPHLGEILLAARQLQEAANAEADGSGALNTGGSDVTVGDLVDLLCSYVDSFGSKACCASDLEPFLAPFEGGAAARLGGGVGVPSDASVRLSTPFEVQRGGAHRASSAAPPFSFAVPEAERARLVASIDAAVGMYAPTEALYAGAAEDAELVATTAKANAAASLEADKHDREAHAAAKAGATAGSGGDGSGSGAAVAAAGGGDGEEDEGIVAARGRIADRQRGMRRYVTALCLQRRLGAHAGFTDEQSRAFAARLVEHWASTKTALNAGGEGGQREVQHGDDLVLLAVHCLCDVARRHSAATAPATATAEASGSGDATVAASATAAGTATARQALLEAAVLLEAARKESAFNFQLKLMLMSIYGWTGTYTEVAELFNSLKVKNIQFESLTYLVLPDALRYGFQDEVRGACNSVTRAHSDDTREVGDHMALAFKMGNLSKVLELDQFHRTSMAVSHQLAQAKAELGHSMFLQAFRSLQEGHAFLRSIILEGQLDDAVLDISPAQLEALVDNRDYDVRVRWAPAVAAGDAGVDAGAGRAAGVKEASKRWLRVRQVLPKALLWAAEGNPKALAEATDAVSAELTTMGLLAPATRAGAGADGASSAAGAGTDGGDAASPAAQVLASGATQPFDTDLPSSGGAGCVDPTLGVANVEALRTGWRGLVSALGACRAALLASGAGDGAADASQWETGAAQIVAATGALAEATAAVTTMAADPARDDGSGVTLPVDPAFLVSAAQLLSGPLPCATFCFTAAAKVLPKQKKAKKGKGGKGGGGGGGGAGAASAVFASALTSGVSALAKALAALSSKCGEAKAALPGKATPESVGLDVAACACAFAGSDDPLAAKARGVMASRVQGGHAANLERAQGLAKDWTAVLRAVKV